MFMVFRDVKNDTRHNHSTSYGVVKQKCTGVDVAYVGLRSGCPSSSPGSEHASYTKDVPLPLWSLLCYMLSPLSLSLSSHHSCLTSPVLSTEAKKVVLWCLRLHIQGKQ